MSFPLFLLLVERILAPAHEPPMRGRQGFG